MRFARAKADGRRRFGFGDGVSGGGGDGDTDGDVVTDTPTTGTTTALDLDYARRNRHVLIYDNITFEDNLLNPNTAEMVMEFQRASDDVWEQGAAAYQYMELDGNLATNPTTAANVPATDGAQSAIYGMFYITGGGLSVPTSYTGRSWTLAASSAGRLHQGFMTSTNQHKAVRLRITTASRTFAGGTVYLMRME